MEFEFSTPTRILFGVGAVQRLVKVGRSLGAVGTSALLVTGKNTKRSDVVQKILAAENIPFGIFSIPGEPTTDMIDAATEQARKQARDFVIGSCFLPGANCHLHTTHTAFVKIRFRRWKCFRCCQGDCCSALQRWCCDGFSRGGWQGPAAQQTIGSMHSDSHDFRDRQ